MQRLFTEHELPRWRDYKQRGALVSYVMAVEVPSHADHSEHSEHDADWDFQEFDRLTEQLQPKRPSSTAGRSARRLTPHLSGERPALAAPHPT